MIEVTMSHPLVPPSLNKIGSRGSHWAYTRAKKEWQQLIGGLLMFNRVPRGLQFVHVEATLRFPLRRGRDAGNFSWMLEKAAGDALVAGGWLPSDVPDHYVFGTVTFEPELGPPRTTLFVKYRVG